jgi:peptidoglycan/xylan/chitin deacetylase (PgdA/CDA1 family)
MRTVTCIAGTITDVVTQERVAALTFDDGPDPVWTPRLLEVLEAYRARATFFMLGARAARHPAVVRRLARAGHAIGNHSWDHSAFPLLSARRRREQIRACQRALGSHGCRLFRPPHGAQTFASRLDALWLGYDVVTWNLSALDWLGRSGGEIADRLLEGLRPGSIVLLHDGLADAEEERFFDRAPTLDALHTLLHRLHGVFTFVTVPELLCLGTPHRVHWVRIPNADFLRGLKRASPDGAAYPAPVT